MNSEQHSGAIRIADDVVITIVAQAVQETEGIAGMSGGISEGLTKRLSGKHVQKGIVASVNGDEAAIDLRVIVHYGGKIREICEALQRNVKEAVENMTGLQVAAVNVKVDGVAFKEEAEPDSI